MKLAVFAAATALLASASISHAADPSSKWSGPYIGVHGTYGWGKTHDTNNPAAEEKSIDGFLGGVQAGYNFRSFNNLVMGIEGDLSFGSVKNNWDDANPFSGYYTEDKLVALGTLRARLGLAIGSFMPYITGGLAVGRMEHTLGCSAALVTGGAGSCLSNPARVFHTSKSDMSVGYSIGGGAEYAVYNNWTVKAEYLYTDLGTNSVTLVDPGFPAAINTRRFDTDFHSVRLGVNYRY